MEKEFETSGAVLEFLDFFFSRNFFLCYGKVKSCEKLKVEMRAKVATVSAIKKIRKMRRRHEEDMKRT